MRKQRSIFLAAVWLLTSCGWLKKSHKDNSIDGPQACLSLVNGHSTQDQPAVVMLLSTKTLCTGTFFRHNALITASHCVNRSANGGKRYIPGSEFSATGLQDAYNHGIGALRSYNQGPYEGEGSKGTPGETDLAIIIFPDHTAPATASFLNRAPSSGEKITLVGFGITQISDSEDGSDGCNSFHKRTGSNQLYLDNTFEGLYYFGRAVTDTSNQLDDSVNASGDSGGPVLIDGKIAGVVSAAGRLQKTDSKGDPIGQTYAVDLSVGHSKAFLDSVAASEKWKSLSE